MYSSYDPVITALMLTTAIAVLVWLIVTEVRREKNKRLATRITASVLAVASLTLLLLRPGVPISESTAEIILVTKGSDHTSVLRLADSLHAEIVVLQDAMQMPFGARSIRLLPDAATLVRSPLRPSIIHLTGDGLMKEDLEQLPPAVLKFYPSPLPTGISDLTAEKKITLGRTLHLQGRVSGLGTAARWLKLLDPSGKPVGDSLKVSSKQNVFTFSDAPRGTGNFFYTLVLDSLRESLGVSVVPPKPLNMLMLESSPSFETRYLKTYSAQSGNRLTVRSRTSKDRYRTESLNYENVSGDPKAIPASAAMFSNYDVIICDDETIRAMSGAERQALLTAVEQAGTGVLIRLTDGARMQSAAVQSMISGLTLTSPLNQTSEWIAPVWTEATGKKVSPIPVSKLRLDETPGAQILAADAKGKSLVAAVARGWGKVAVSVPCETHLWVLEGNRKTHAAYWSAMLTMLAKKSTGESMVMPSGEFFFEDKPMRVSVYPSRSSDAATVETASGDTQKIYFRSASGNASERHARYWPRETGWHAIALRQGDTASVYVHAQSEWTTWQRAQRQTATADAAEMRQSKASQGLKTSEAPAASPVPAARRTLHQPMPLWWCYIVFLLGAAYLWAERKF
ncbi:MAG: hypothetical protein IAF08_11665 [Rhizobacter sp.]|nr:hypothetical protein [Chlorobiales bacterium]